MDRGERSLDRVNKPVFFSDIDAFENSRMLSVEEVTNEEEIRQLSNPTISHSGANLRVPATIGFSQSTVAAQGTYISGMYDSGTRYFKHEERMKDLEERKKQRQAGNTGIKPRTSEDNSRNEPYDYSLYDIHTSIDNVNNQRFQKSISPNNKEVDYSFLMMDPPDEDKSKSSSEKIECPHNNTYQVSEVSMGSSADSSMHLALSIPSKPSNAETDDDPESSFSWDKRPSSSALRNKSGSMAIARGSTRQSVEQKRVVTTDTEKQQDGTLIVKKTTNIEYDTGSMRQIVEIEHVGPRPPVETKVSKRMKTVPEHMNIMHVPPMRKPGGQWMIMTKSNGCLCQPTKIRVYEETDGHLYDEEGISVKRSGKLVKEDQSSY